MDADSWTTSADWIATWKSLSPLDDADRLRRLIANELCRPLLSYLTDHRYGMFFDLSTVKAEGRLTGEEDWDQWEDGVNGVSESAIDEAGAIESAAAWVVAGLGNDDHKIGRALESLPHFYGCLAALEAGVVERNTRADAVPALRTHPTYRTGHDEHGPRRVIEMIREFVRNPFRVEPFDPSWRTEAVVGLARGMYDSRDFAPMPVLADALEDAGCASADILAHCRGPGPHIRGCWVVDLVLGKN